MTPQAFLPNQSAGYHPPAIVPNQGVRPVLPIEPPRPPRSAAVLSVRLPNRVTLSRALVEAIDKSVKSRELGKPKSQRARVGFGPGSVSTEVELVPPARRGGTWHLDTRPTAGRRLPKTVGARAQFETSHHLKAEHFLCPPRVIGEPNTVRSRLQFTLGVEVEGQPGYYTLLPL